MQILTVDLYEPPDSGRTFCGDPNCVSLTEVTTSDGRPIVLHIRYENGSTARGPWIQSAGTHTQPRSQQTKYQIGDSVSRASACVNGKYLRVTVWVTVNGVASGPTDSAVIECYPVVLQ